MKATKKNKLDNLFQIEIDDDDGMTPFIDRSSSTVIKQKPVNLHQKCLNRIANILKKTDLSFNKLHYLATLNISNKPCQLNEGNHVTGRCLTCNQKTIQEQAEHTYNIVCYYSTSCSSIF
jgi:hypothetical protein